jgi:hypothetical protein
MQSESSSIKVYFADEFKRNYRLRLDRNDLTAEGAEGAEAEKRDE